MKHFDIDDLRVIAGPACSPTLVQSMVETINTLADRRSFRVTPYKNRRFKDTEEHPQIQQNVRLADVFVVQPTPPPNENHHYLTLLLDAAKRASCSSLTAVLPYAGYLRQDRKDRPRVPITSKVTLNQIEKAMYGVRSHFIFFHPHFTQVQGFIESSSDILYPGNVFLDAVGKIVPHFHNVVVVAPDAGAAKLATRYANMIGKDLAIVHKDRDEDGRPIIKAIIGDVRGKIALIVDDIGDTGGTILAVEPALREAGAIKVITCLTHAVLADNAAKKLGDSGIDHIFVTNTIHHAPETLPAKFQVLDIGATIGEAIWRTHTGDSISDMEKMFNPKI